MSFSGFYIIVCWLLVLLMFSPKQVSAFDKSQQVIHHTSAINPDLPSTAMGTSPVHVDDELIASSGIKISIIKSTKFSPELPTYGLAIDIQPLLELRSTYFAEKANLIGAKADFSVDQLALARLQKLHRDEAVATRKLQRQKFQWQSSKANQDSKRYQIEANQAQAMLNWGHPLASRCQ